MMIVSRNCSVMYCVLQLYTISVHSYEQLYKPVHLGLGLFVTVYVFFLN